MGGATKGFSNIGHSVGNIARGKMNAMDWINVTPVGAFAQIGAGAAGINLNKVAHIPGTGGGSGDSSTANPGPFSLDMDQLNADQGAIRAVGKQQYDQTMQELPKNVTNAINQALPNIEETLNSQHLLNGTALPQELARQSSYFTQNLAAPALQNLQGFQTGALQRGLSLEDFTNQANVAKAIGAQVAPQVGNGKGGAVAGLGAGASAGTAIMPGWGTAIGGALGAASGYAVGGGANGGRGK